MTTARAERRRQEREDRRRKFGGWALVSGLKGLRRSVFPNSPQSQTCDRCGAQAKRTLRLGGELVKYACRCGRIITIKVK